jgi:hypothetical protein
MAEENVRSDEVGPEPKNDAARRWLFRLAALLIAFLLGLVPMWWAKMGVDYELEQAKRDLRRHQIQNTLSAAAVYARRGEYETARQSVSAFFTETQAELDNADSKVLTAAERSQLPGLMSGRDDVITLLSRGDPAAAERLSDIYVAYRAVTGGAQP